MTAIMDLPPPARFFPLATGRYEIAAGLRPLGTDFGNGAADEKTFLIDREYPHYREAKLRARTERLEKYYPEHSRLEDPLRRAATKFIAETLARDYPELFSIVSQPQGMTLTSLLTEEEFMLNEDRELLQGSTSVEPPYRDALDAFATLLQEDIAIWRRDPETNEEWLAALHLCFPNHWAAEDKVGKPFNDVHAPVAGFQRLARAAPSIVEGMVFKGPFVRFAWGLATDRELNHHPANEFKGRLFDPQKPELFLRIERQTITSFPFAGGALFTIRTYFLDCAKDLSAQERAALVSAIGSMTPESLAYKGLAATKEAILKWLRGL
ncbi:MAG TPA: DUF3445 domain-containing protein [Planctomycetota bacterium]|nr:DUF3445 domain-containing protein [Planctomycetota bacterium]